MNSSNERAEAGLKIVREFNAPVALVFAAFANADAFAAWWGPAGMPVTVRSFDFRKGGHVHYKMEGNGQVMWGLFKFGEITEPTRIAFTNSFSDEEGNMCPSPLSLTPF